MWAGYGEHLPQGCGFIVRRSPVILFVYNRPLHLKETLQHLAAAAQSHQTDLIVYSDGPKSPAHERSVNDVRDLLSNSKELRAFNRVTIRTSQKNKGLQSSIRDGVTDVIAELGTAVVLEDDLAVASDFLVFMNEALERFEGEPVVANISGYSPIAKMPKHYKKDVYVASRNCSHGWATWRDRWQSIQWDAPGFAAFIRDPKLRREFNRYGSDQADRLMRQLKYGAQSWAVLVSYWQFVSNLVTVYPAISRVKNLGFDGSGVHVARDVGKFNSLLQTKNVPFELELPAEDETVRKYMYSIYSGPFAARIARVLRVNGLEGLESRIRRTLGL